MRHSPLCARDSHLLVTFRRCNGSNNGTDKNKEEDNQESERERESQREREKVKEGE